MEAFAAVNKSKPDEIAKLFSFVNESILSDSSENDVFLTKAKDLFLLLKAQDIDLAQIKRQETETFEKLSTRIAIAIENGRASMEFSIFLETLTCLLNCDAFLLDKNIFDLLIECMLREKSAEELKSYEKFLSIVLKIYGKDLSQFLKKVLKTLNVKLNSFTITKKRKRKQLSGSNAEVSPKKQKLTEEKSSDRRCDWMFISHIWPKSIDNQFSEAIASLNVAQSMKVWKQLNSFLTQALQKLQEPSGITENVLLCIDFASNLLCALFVNTRLQEQLMYKQEEVASLAKGFNDTQSLFYEIIVNVEYNSRTMNAFLKLTSCYEHFSMLFYYHHSAGASNELDSLFVGNSSKVKNEWKIIHQRIKNFGQTDEKNHLNSLIIQQRQKSELFKCTDDSKIEDFSSILADDQQIDYLLRSPDTRSFFISSMEANELQMFAQHLIKLNDKGLQSAALTAITQRQTLLDAFVGELVQSVDQTEFKSVLDILAQLPLTCLSDVNKKLVFEELLRGNHSNELRSLIEMTATSLLKNDSYKHFFKDFTMNKLVEKFSKIEDYEKAYHAIFTNAARKLSRESLENFEWTLQKDESRLLFILAEVASEIAMTPTTVVTADEIRRLKSDLVKKLLKNFGQNEIKKFSEKTCKGLFIVTKMCGENASTLNEEIKEEYVNLLQRAIKNIVKTPNTERVNLLLVTLKEAKKFNLNDEIKGTIVDCLLTYLKSLLAARLSAEADVHLDVDQERQLFEALKPFKSNFQEGCVNAMRQQATERELNSCSKLKYCFKIYQIAFNNVDKASSGVIKSYLKFLDTFDHDALTSGDAALITQVLETNNSILKENKFQLNNTSIDEFLSVLTDPRIRTVNFSIEDFSRFYGALGESLFLIANGRQNYFKSRIPQFFTVYKSFIEAIYFYKNDQPEELSQMEISLLLTLTLQLENIMNMVVKNHASSIKVISLYVASSIVSIFVRNPKTLSVGYKFKMNIKNICYQLLSTIDDKTRKHVYSVADETTRGVYDGLFSELRRKA